MHGVGAPLVRPEDALLAGAPHPDVRVDDDLARRRAARLARPDAAVPILAVGPDALREKALAPVVGRADRAVARVGVQRGVLGLARRAGVPRRARGAAAVAAVPVRRLDPALVDPVGHEPAVELQAVRRAVGRARDGRGRPVARVVDAVRGQVDALRVGVAEARVHGPARGVQPVHGRALAALAAPLAVVAPRVRGHDRRRRVVRREEDVVPLHADQAEQAPRREVVAHVAPRAPPARVGREDGHGPRHHQPHEERRRHVLHRALVQPVVVAHEAPEHALAAPAGVAAPELHVAGVARARPERAHVMVRSSSALLTRR